MPRIAIIYFVTTLFTLSIFCSTAYAEGKTTRPEPVKMDRVVAIVDQSVITEQELNDRIRSVIAQLEKNGVQIPPENILQKQILERLIVDSLQLQYAAQTGIKVDDTQLNRTVERVAEQNKMQVADFRAALEKDGVNFRKFREDMRNEIVVARLREREIESRVNVSDGEIDNYLTTQTTSGSQDEYEISHILIRAQENSSPEELQKLKAKADDAMMQLQKGTDFLQVSASTSDAPNALEGGVLGWKPASQLPALFLDTLKVMQPGDVSPVIRSPNGFHILKLTNRRGTSSPLLIEQSHTRHILIKLSEVVSESEGKHKLETIRERIVHGDTKFADMARQYSEDGSANNGGDMGWVNPGDTVPAFEKAMNELEIGQVSVPVRTPFGWHLIQVTERRKQDMSKEAARLKARQEIRARKADEAYQDWLREQRDRAYVELKLEDKF